MSPTARRFLRCHLVMGALLTACAAEPSGATLPADPGSEVPPAASLGEQREAPPVAAGSTLDASGRVASDAVCAASDLSASYRFDASAQRGRIVVRWRASVDTAAAVAIEIEGAAPEAGVVASGERRYVAGTRLQDSTEVDGDVRVAVRVELACGASVENVFVFEDPIKRCEATRLEAIAGNETTFYECAELWLAQGEGCGEDGYLVGYGGRYAQKFYRETRPSMSERGQAWLDHTLVCLQEELRDAIALGTSCEDVKNIAFDLHPDCYAESGVCTLPVSDILQIPQTIDGADLTSQEGLRQLVGILPQCGEEYAEAITGQSDDDVVASAP